MFWSVSSSIVRTSCCPWASFCTCSKMPSSSFGFTGCGARGG